MSRRFITANDVLETLFDDQSSSDENDPNQNIILAVSDEESDVLDVVLLISIILRIFNKNIIKLNMRIIIYSKNLSYAY